MKKAHQERQGTAMKQREPEDAKRKARAERFYFLQLLFLKNA